MELEFTPLQWTPQLFTIVMEKGGVPSKWITTEHTQLALAYARRGRRDSYDGMIYDVVFYARIGFSFSVTA
ncbi:hypothetical protein LXL04_004603 [Taraxacum kok-saghyz]